VQTEAAMPVSERVAELNYVTEHFTDLQGLTAVPILAALLVCIVLAGEWEPVAARPFSWAVAGSVASGFVLSLAASEAVSRWYKRRFGVVKNGLWRGATPRAKRLTMASRVIIAVVMFIVWEYSNVKALVMMGTLTGLFPRCYETVPPIPALRLRRLLYVTALGMQLALLGSRIAFHLEFLAMLGGMVGSYLCLGLYDHWLLTHLLRESRPGRPVLEATHE
jgi:hypothetical protein